MVLQKIIAPNEEYKNLYFRQIDLFGRDIADEYKVDKTDISTFPIKLKQREVISFETYVNACSIEKWFSYTDIDNLYIEIKTRGKINLHIYNSVGVQGKNGDYISGRNKIESKITKKKRNGINCYTINVTELKKFGVIFCTIEAMEDVEIISGEYYTRNPKNYKEIKLAIIINTYQDIKFTKQVIEKINNQARDIDKQIDIYVSDQSGELPIDTFAEENVLVINSDRFPGSGINKAMDKIKKSEATHVIFIDNGVLPCFELENIISFLSLLDKAHEDVVIQGDLVAYSTKSKLDNSGYIFKDGEFENRFWDLDLNDINNIAIFLQSDVIDAVNDDLVIYPVRAFEDSKISQKVRNYSDIEFSIMNNNNIVELNGFYGEKQLKRNEGIILKSYYNTLDKFIISSRLEKSFSKEKIKNTIKNTLTKEIKRGNIEVAEVIIMATNEYLNGPRMLEDSEHREEINKKILDLQNAFNDSLVKEKIKKSISFSPIKIMKEYNELCVRIDKEYENVIYLWKEFE